MSSKLNRKFKRQYDFLFRHNPAAANLFLLLSEIADAKGQIFFNDILPEAEIQKLMMARFPDPWAYYLTGGPKG